MKKTVAIQAKQIAEKLGLSEHDANMSVINVPVDEDEYRSHLKNKTGARSVDLITATIQLPSVYQGQAVGSNALIRVTFMNGIYINDADGRPSWINFDNIRKLLEVEGVTIKGSRRLCYNMQPLMRVITGSITEVSAKDASNPKNKLCRDFWSGLPDSLKDHIKRGVKLHVIPFFYSAISRPRASKDTGLWETRIDLYKMSDVLDDPKISSDRHFGPRKDPRQRGKQNSVQYGLIGSSKMDTESSESKVTISYTHLYYVQWIGYFNDKGEWVDEGSRILVMDVATINRARVAYYKVRCQPAVYEAFCGGSHILPSTLLEKPAEEEPAGEPAKQPAPVGEKGPEPKKSESGGGGNGSGTTLGDLLAAKGQSLPKSDPPKSDKAAERPAS